MVKLGQIARKVGRNLASLAVGASIILGASNVKATGPTLDIGSTTNVYPYGEYCAHYTCPNVKFNNRTSDKKIVLIYKFHNNADGNDYFIGGLTVPANSLQTSYNESYLQGKKSIYKGLSTGQFATNGLNGTSQWVGGIDLNGNGIVGTYDNTNINWEPGEYISLDRIHIFDMHGMPTNKLDDVFVGGVYIEGYQDGIPSQNISSNGIPDYFEEKYQLPNDITKLTDTDHDGQTDYQEWVAGTDPTNAASYFGVKSFDNGTNTFALNIGNTLEGRVYGVQATTNLANSAWTNAIPEVDGNGTNTLYITKDPMKQQEFYKPYVNLSSNEVVNP